MNDSLTLKEFLELAKKFNAGSLKMIMREKDNSPKALFLVVNGKEECEEILPLIEKVEDGWS